MSQLSGFDDVQAAKRLLSHAGLTFPPLPTHFAPYFKEWGPWSFATRPPSEHSPYEFHHYVKEGTSADVQDYMLLAHAGHGVNSYALHFYLVNGPLRLFLQLGYGGVYMDNESSCRVINESFSVASQLVTALDAARGTRGLEHNDTLLIAGSALYGTYWVRPHGSRRRRYEIRTNCPIFEEPLQALKDALKWAGRNERRRRGQPKGLI